MIDNAIRGIVFDMDGVLIHSAPSHAAAFQQVFAACGIYDFEYAPYAGWRTPEVIADVLARRGRSPGAETIAGIAGEKSRLARQLLMATDPLAKNCAATLARLAGVYQLALASSGSRSSVDAFLKLTGSRSLFRSVLSGDDVARAKPNPEIYVRSAEALGMAPAECLVVEDAVAGVAAALAAGCQVVAIAGTCPAEALREAGAEQIIAGLSELAALG